MGNLQDIPVGQMQQEYGQRGGLIRGKANGIDKSLLFLKN